MSLTKVNQIDVIKNQYMYKLKSYSQVFMSLIYLQALAVLFSMNGVGNMGTSDESFEIYFKYFSPAFVVVFTMLWGFITAITITTKAYRNDDFVFVTNRVSSNLSNVVFLLTASLIGGITAMLSSYLIKVIVYYFFSDLLLKTTAVMAAPNEFFLGALASVLYIILSSALGYLVGTLVQISKVFAILLPAAFIGGLIYDGLSGKSGLLAKGFEFFFMEPSLPLFITKIIITAGLLFVAAISFANRMEVRS